MFNYKEKALYHIKTRMLNKYIVREVEGKKHVLELIFFKEPIAFFSNWEDCYKYLKLFTKSSKRKWLDNVATSKLLWDTDLEPYEQETIKDIQEIYDYKYSSLDIAELSEILTDLTDEELKKSINNLVYSLEYIYNKETIEIE